VSGNLDLRSDGTFQPEHGSILHESLEWQLEKDGCWIGMNCSGGSDGDEVFAGSKGGCPVPA
jgi:hypothetical protein